MYVGDVFVFVGIFEGNTTCFILLVVEDFCGLCPDCEGDVLFGLRISIDA
eukprot:JP444262.1.p2 GENE.JP444262.1~~JP444262.1.p2  ORF type:complete len:50 (+),score=3.69 JP444262.1:10-159(+)